MIRKIVLCILSFLMLFGVFAGVGIMMVSAKELTPVTTESGPVVQNGDLVEVSMKEVLQKFKDNESFYVYFGYEACPWCKEAKPILKKQIKKANMNVYYVKTRDKDGNRLYSEKQRKQLVKYISKYMKKNKDENNKLWLYVPLLVKVDDGKTVDGHQGTIKGHNAKERKMTNTEKKKLNKIYTELLQD